MSKLRQLKEKRAALYADVCRLRDEADGRDMTAEERSNWQKAVADVTDIDKQIEAEERFMAMQAQQAQEQPQPKNDEKRSLESRAFIKYLLGAQLTQEEVRSIFAESRDALTPGVSNASAIVPGTITSEIERALGGATDLLAAVSSFTTATGGDLTMPTVNDLTSRAKIVAEYQKGTRAQKTFGSITFKAYTYRTDLIPISEELMQDAVFNVESEIARLLSEQFARGLNYDFTNGSEGSEIKGIVAEATAVAAAGNSAVTFDDLIDLVKSVKAGYNKNGKWMFNSNVLAELMKIKDNNEQYIWQPAVANAVAATIWGKPYVLNDDMPDIAAGASPVVYGDLSKYRVRYVKGYTARRFNELLGEYLAVGFMGFGRVDAKLMDAGTHPIVKLQLGA